MTGIRPFTFLHTVAVPVLKVGSVATVYYKNIVVGFPEKINARSKIIYVMIYLVVPDRRCQIIEPLFYPNKITRYYT